MAVFHCDVAASHYDQASRGIFELQQRLVGQIIHLVQTLKRRHDGTGAAGNEDMPGGDFLAVDLDGLFVYEPSFALVKTGVFRAEQRLPYFVPLPSGHLSHPPHNGGEIDLLYRGSDAQLR